MNDIIDSARITNNSYEVQRNQLITKQDIYNILKSFKSNGAVIRRESDSISVESWVEEHKEDVLYFKPQGKMCDKHPNLNKDDFILILMNKGQKEMLSKFEKKKHLCRQHSRHQSLWISTEYDFDLE